MGRISESGLRKLLSRSPDQAIPPTRRLQTGHDVRAIQIWHIDNTGPYKGMLEVLPDAEWDDPGYDMVLSADMVKNDVKMTNASISRSTLKFAKGQEPYVRIGFLQQIANLAPIIGQASIERGLRHAAENMTDAEIQAVLFEHKDPAELSDDERPIAAALTDILAKRGGQNRIAELMTGNGMASPDAARAEMSAFQKFKAALQNDDIGAAYMPGFRSYFKHWKMAGLEREPAPDHVGIQWSADSENPHGPPIPTGFVSREEEHQGITKATDGSDLDDELILIPGYKVVDGQRRPAVVLVRDPASPGNNIVKLISDDDANKLGNYFGEDLYWHEITGGPGSSAPPPARPMKIVDMPKAITEGPLLSDVEWKPELTAGLPRKKAQMWEQSSGAGYVGALANAVYTLDMAGLYNPERHNLNASDGHRRHRQGHRRPALDAVRRQRRPAEGGPRQAAAAQGRRGSASRTG